MDRKRQLLFNTTDMLQGNINRMCVTDDAEELVRQHKAAMQKLHWIFQERLFEIIGGDN